MDPRSIVIGADGSEHADRALLWAVKQARLEHRPLAMVAVDENASAIADRTVALASQSDPSLTVEALSRTGDPPAVLLEASQDAHLMVLGARGCGTVTSLLLGLVSSAVSAHAACPVVGRPVTGDR